MNHLKDVHGKFDGFHNIIHIGGDEVPHDGATVIWESSPICQTFIQEVCFEVFWHKHMLHYVTYIVRYMICNI